MSQQIKLIYLGPLVEGRGHEAFRERWRQHGALAMGLPFWDQMARYKQCDVLTAGEGGLTEEQLAPMRTADYGGVGMIWFHDWAALEAASATEDSATMTTDETPTFGRPLGTNLTPTVENIVIDGEPGPITLVGAVHRQPTVDRATFSQRWRDHGAKLAERPEIARHVRRYVQNHGTPEAEYCDGFVELSFASPDELTSFMAAYEASGLLTIELEFVDLARLEAVVTAENLLYDNAA